MPLRLPLPIYKFPPTIMNFNDLRKYCNENNNIPTDENEQYIPFSYINEAEERFIVIWSSPKMLTKISSKFTSHIATYKLNWNEYPVFVSGISTPTGVFFQTYMALSSHEDTTAWSYIFKFHKSVIGTYPKFCMADGAWEITNAVKDIMGKYTTIVVC